MPPAILSLWRGETVPYELTSSAAGFGHHGTTTGFWGTGEPGATNRYIYRHPDYAIGSGFIEYYPNEFYVQHHSNELTSTLHWLDISESRWADEESVLGGDSVQITAPGEGHWAALISLTN